MRGGKTIMACATCNIEFKRMTSWIKPSKSGNRYCSVSCRNAKGTRVYKKGVGPTEATRAKMRASHIKINSIKHIPIKRGKEHYNWRGGVTSENETIRKSTEYKIWRLAVYQRDGYTCLMCGKVGGKLNVDHIKPFSLYPELRLDINNGRTLCEICHRKTPTYGFAFFNKTMKAYKKVIKMNN